MRFIEGVTGREKKLMKTIKDKYEKSEDKEL
jgi:hypothetical protein